MVCIIFLAYGYLLRHITEHYQHSTFKQIKNNLKLVFIASGSNFIIVIPIFFSS